MTWSEHYFKGKRVFVQLDEEGEFVLDDGRVPMKYSASDDAKVYHAHPGNISASGPKKKKKSKKKNGAPTQRSLTFNDLVWEKPLGERVESDDVPTELVELDPPDDGILEFHTDGACSGNPGPCGYGLVLRDGEDYFEVSQYIGLGTNNIAELYAILVALQETAERGRPAVIHTDSQLSIGLLTQNWKAKANRELVAACRDTLRDVDATFVKVKGHAGLPLNERADDLAVAAVDRST